MERLQDLLYWINRKAGGIGSIISVAFWIVVLGYALTHMVMHY